MNKLKLIFVILTFPIYLSVLLLFFIYFSFKVAIVLSKMFIYGNLDEIKKIIEKLKKYVKL